MHTPAGKWNGYAHIFSIECSNTDCFALFAPWKWNRQSTWLCVNVTRPITFVVFTDLVSTYCTLRYVGWGGGYRGIRISFAWSYCGFKLSPNRIHSQLPPGFYFFIGNVVYFYKIVRMVFDSMIARYSTLIYLVLPLSIYYSRAIHIDFLLFSDPCHGIII